MYTITHIVVGVPISKALSDLIDGWERNDDERWQEWEDLGFEKLYSGVEFSLGREIVREKVTYTSSIRCEWTDGMRGCCEVWKHESNHVISVREALELAAKDGWIVVCDRPVCGCHIDDPDDTDISDLSDMRKHFEVKER